MIELKTYKMVDEKYCTDCVCVIPSEVYLKKDADEAITELKQKLMPCLNGDCILTCEVVEKYGKENAELKNEIKRKEGVGKRWFERCMEARAENVRLKRALWLAREWRAWCEGEFWLAVESDEPGDIYHLKCTNRIHRAPNEWTTYWHKVEQLCKKMAEEYK